MSTNTTRLSLSKPAAGDLVSSFQGTISTTLDTIDSSVVVLGPTQVDAASYGDDINAAMAALPSGGKVWLTKPLYTISSPVVMLSRCELDSPGTWSVHGSSAGNTVKDYHSPTLRAANGLNNDVIQFPAACSNARVAGIAIDGNSANQSSGNGIRFIGSGALPRNDNMVERVLVNSAKGIGILCDVDHYEPQLRHILVLRAGGAGIDIGGQDARLDSILSGYNGGDGLILRSPADSSYLRGIELFYNTGAGARFSGLYSAQIVQFQSHNNQQEGLVLADNVDLAFLSVRLFDNGLEFDTSAIRYPDLRLTHATTGQVGLQFAGLGFHFDGGTGRASYGIQDDQPVPSPVMFGNVSFRGTWATGETNFVRPHLINTTRKFVGGFKTYLRSSSYLGPEPTLTTTGAPANQNEYAVPVEIDGTGTLSEIGCEVTTAGESRVVADGVLNSTTTITSATAAFVAGDVGKSVVGTNIPTGAYIASVTNGTTAVMSAAATATASGVSLTFGCVIRLGIRRDDGNGYPANVAPLVDAGFVLGYGANGYRSIVISLAVNPGLYWLTATVQGASVTPPTMRTMNGGDQRVQPTTGASATNKSHNGYRQAAVTTTLPSTFNTALDPQGGSTRVVVKVA